LRRLCIGQRSAGFRDNPGRLGIAQRPAGLRAHDPLSLLCPHECGS
jgi:hypothetical protein